MNGARFALGVLAPLLFALCAREARAAAPLVVLVRPAPDNEIVSEALVRLQGELESLGFTVSVVDTPPETDPKRLTESAGRALSSAATIVMFDRTEGVLELWIADRLTGKTVVRQVAVGDTDGRSRAQVLAIRAAELLRASLAETLLQPSEAPEPEAPSPPAVAHWMQASITPPAPHPVRVGLEAGAGVFGSFSGLGPAVVPMVRARMSLGEYVALRVGAAGLGTSSKVEGVAATADVSQEVVLADGQVRFLPGALVQPTLSLGAGAYGMLVQGEAAWPYEGRSGSQWSPAFAATVGVAVRLHASLELALEGQAIVATSSPTVRFFQDEPARGGRPSYLASLSLVGWQ
jgi:hypothetical protein